MKTKNKKEEKKAIFIIANLIVSIIAFSFLIGNIDLVRADTSKAPVAGGGTAAEKAAELVKGVPPGAKLVNGLKVVVGGKEGVIKGLNTAKDTFDFLANGAEKSVPTSVSKIEGFYEAGTAGGEKAAGGLLGALAKETILTSLFWGATVGGLVYMAAGFFGASPDAQKAWGAAAFAGVTTWGITNPLLSGKGITAFGKTFWASKTGSPLFGLTGPQASLLSFGIAVGVAFLVFALLYKKTSSEIVSFQCKPYNAPTGGQYCELCNKDKFRPCSEYRCKSLGQACELLNVDTGNETCAWVNPNDVKSPEIAPWNEIISLDHEYKDVKTRPPGTGMRIVRKGASDGCIKAFTPLAFGITTNEPAQCKIDYNHTKKFDDMAYYFGETNLYLYNHSQTLRLPGPNALNAQAPELENDGTFTLYTRCQDANGNINEDEFAIRFCVEKGPDTTPPKIEGTSIPSGMPVQYNLNDTDIEVYVNEPANCNWSRQDKDMGLMETEMTCDENVFDINNLMLYKCFTTLTGFENRKNNEFYFKCKDQPWLEGTDKANDRNINTESYLFIIKGTQPLNIMKTAPNGTIQGYADIIGVDLIVETHNGYNKGDAICYYSQTDSDETYIKMFETGTNKHKQRQDRSPGTYTYYFKCVDLGGNTDYNKTTFTIEVDRIAPVVIRVYNEGGNLKLETDEKSTCSYSTNINQKCNFDLSTGTQMLYTNASIHYAEWKTNTNYYIKCTDTSGNQPNPIDCSIIVRPYNEAS